MQTANQNDPFQNTIRMLVLHSAFFPDEARRAKAKEELIEIIWNMPSRAERVAIHYIMALLTKKETGHGINEKTMDGRHPGAVLDEGQEKMLLELLKTVREEAREARLSRVKDRKELVLARKAGRSAGMPVSLRVH